jgi:integral membrane protein (TIGR01906 family)
MADKPLVTASSDQHSRLLGLAAVLHLFLIVGLPVFLVLTGVRLVMTNTYLQLEYNRPGFPEDRFGFTKEDRLNYAPYAIRYLLNDSGIGYLGDLKLDGEPMYTARELRHMEDVKTVTRAALSVHLILTLVLVAACAFLIWYPETRWRLWRGLFEGGALTIAAIITLSVLIVASWDFFFTEFHGIFFEGDSWQFSTSDTLIRLFPEQFWFDTAITIGLFAIAGSLTAMLVSWLRERRTHK